MRITAWLKHLRKRRGSTFIQQMLRMWKFHRTSFDEILGNIFVQLDTYQAKFTFPTIASVISSEPDNIRSILRNGHEIANHGYKHVKYSLLSEAEQREEFELSTQVFSYYKIPIRGFRAPYNNYNDKTIQLVQEFGFEWDGGIGYKHEYRYLNQMFHLNLNSTQSDFIVIPLHRFSDDLLIDRYHLNADDMSYLFKKVINKASKTGGLVMFDLHPIRIGQNKYAPALSEIVEFAYELGGWMPTVSQAVHYWNSHNKWKGDADFCLLLTGDIDNFVFMDYLRRLY